jgi:hypothetical protein
MHFSVFWKRKMLSGLEEYTRSSTDKYFMSIEGEQLNKSVGFHDGMLPSSQK